MQARVLQFWEWKFLHLIFWNFLQDELRTKSIAIFFGSKAPTHGAPIYLFFPTFSPFSFFDNCLVSLRIGGEVTCCHLELTVRPLLHDFTICFLDTKSAILPMCRICYCVHCGKNWIELDSQFMVPKPISKSIWMYKCIICFFLFSGLKIESHLIFKS